MRNYVLQLAQLRAEALQAAADNTILLDNETSTPTPPRTPTPTEPVQSATSSALFTNSTAVDGATAARTPTPSNRN